MNKTMLYSKPNRPISYNKQDLAVLHGSGRNGGKRDVKFHRLSSEDSLFFIGIDR